MLLNPVLSAVSPSDLQAGALFLRIGAAIAVSLGFALVARWLRAVTRGGAVCGTLLGFVLYFSAGPAAFVALASVFVVVVLATRFRYARKHAMGTAEQPGGRRATQVMANLGVAAFLTALFALSKDPVMLIGMAAALAEAAADTVSSECGQAMSDRARLITTWASVPAGTDGGISIPGTMAGIFAALIIALTCTAVGLVPLHAVVVICVAAILGMLFDSFLGASLERRRRLNNDHVNLFSTMFSSLIALLVARVWA